MREVLSYFARNSPLPLTVYLPMVETATSGGDRGNMTLDERDDVTTFLRTTLAALVPAPSQECRQRAWKTFEQALERHLAQKRPALSAADSQH